MDFDSGDSCRVEKYLPPQKVMMIIRVFPQDYGCGDLTPALSWEERDLLPRLSQNKENVILKERSD